MDITNTSRQESPISVMEIDENFYEEEHIWPEMSDVEKEIILEWLSLGENPQYANESCHGVNLRELIKILVKKYNVMSRNMPNTSILQRIRAFNWTPYSSSVNITPSVLSNPLCTLLMYRIIIEMSKDCPDLNDENQNLNTRIVEQFEVIKLHYFNLSN